MVPQVGHVLSNPVYGGATARRDVHVAELDAIEPLQVASWQQPRHSRASSHTFIATSVR